MGTLIHALATYRLIRAWFWEQVGEKPRQAVTDWTAMPVMNNHGDVDVRLTQIKQWLADLFDCPYCLSFWTALGVVIAQRFRLARPFVSALAAATLVAVALDHYPDVARQSAEEPADVG